MNPSSPRILIVDDSPDDALLAQIQLKRVAPDATFQRVDSEPGLRQALASGEWDLVICDHQMPQLDSSRALELLKEHGRGETPFVIYSGHFDQQRALDAMERGAHDFIDKHDPSRLAPVVERELRHSVLKRARDTAESSVVRLSRFDPLTHLPNRGFFGERVSQALAEHPGRGMPALVYFDIDRFMRINESFGYPAGDALMRQVAQRLQDFSGRGAILGRAGRDEFAVFLPANADPFSARRYAELLAARFADGFPLHGQEIFLTLSIGVSLFPDHGGDEAALARNAESAMFSAKRLGGNRIQIYERALNHSASRKLKLENALRHAVEKNELFLQYQPVADAMSGRVESVEALVRWRHPEYGIIPPDQFIPLAEETGLITPIGDWVLDTALTQTRFWRDQGFEDLSIAVNFSAEQFRDPMLPAKVMAALDRAQMPPDSLEIEITESVAMEDASAAIARLRALKDLGIRLAIDDFGTGYSSLSYLKRFPIDVLKIDKSFVQSLPDDEEDAAIVTTLSVLGHSLQLTLHAEGVETVQQAHFLRKLGCHRIQGHWLARPLKPADVVALLTERNAPLGIPGAAALAIPTNAGIQR
ncbi:hypothetical protein BWI17_17745 [Betaproteobacteria bacterium GR16-43]|nr:hypothetical protein BWI17_17745 [Betaproteobacteria bacterium GR16-43]